MSAFDPQPAASALVLFSGGQDSATCLAWAMERYARVETVGFDYGQRHAVEMQARLAVRDGMRAALPQGADRLGEDHVVDLTGYGAIATAVAAVKAGAVDYLQKPADADDVVKALLATGDAPEPPDNPMSADRVRWEHIQRVYELCDHNVSETARRLGMHRRTLQRILAKRALRRAGASGWGPESRRMAPPKSSATIRPISSGRTVCGKPVETAK